MLLVKASLRVLCVSPTAEAAEAAEAQPTGSSLNRPAIVAAAIEIARSDGIEAVTMRRLAAALGTSAMSLYRHVDDRRSLLVEMLDDVAGRIDVPAPSDDPRTEVTGIFTAIHDALRADPWAVGLIVSDKLAGPRIIPYVERTYSALARAGLSRREVSAAYALVWHYTAGELIDSHHISDDDFRRVMMRESVDPDRHPTLAKVLEELPSSPPRDHFADNLQHLLDGLDLA